MARVSDISKDFGFWEFEADNAPPAVKAAITRLVTRLLQPLRDFLGKPLSVTSGWRPDDADSDHRFGGAGDVKCEGLSSRELAQKVMLLVTELRVQGQEPDGVYFDQLIWYNGDDHHIHLGERGDANRGMVLHCVKTSERTYYHRSTP